VSEVLALCKGEAALASPTDRLQVFTVFGGENEGAGLVEHVVVGTGPVAAAKRLKAVHESQSVELGQPMLGGVEAVEADVTDLLRRKNTMRSQETKDPPITLGQMIRQPHHQPVIHPRAGRSASHRKMSIKSGTLFTTD
jgi:hypothetical protein